MIGAATLSTAVGWTSLGDYIFSGLQTENWVLVLFGCLSAALLALITDQLLALIEVDGFKDGDAAFRRLATAEVGPAVRRPRHVAHRRVTGHHFIRVELASCDFMDGHLAGLELLQGAGQDADEGQGPDQDLAERRVAEQDLSNSLWHGLNPIVR